KAARVPFRVSFRRVDQCEVHPLASLESHLRRLVESDFQRPLSDFATCLEPQRKNTWRGFSCHWSSPFLIGEKRSCSPASASRTTPTARITPSEGSGAEYRSHGIRITFLTRYAPRFVRETRHVGVVPVTDH